MRLPLKLSSIDQEHLQELYDQTNVPRDRLPYTEAFEALCQGFQDRTFKNAHQEQVYNALLKYVRSGSPTGGEEPPVSTLTEEHLKQIKALLPRFAKGNKIAPYSDEFESALKEFNKVASMDLSSGDFWRAILRAQGPKRKPPVRAKVKVTAPAEADEDEDGE